MERMCSQEGLGLPFLHPHERIFKKAIWRKQTLKLQSLLREVDWSSEVKRQGSGVWEEGRPTLLWFREVRAQLSLPLQ